MITFSTIDNQRSFNIPLGTHNVGGYTYIVTPNSIERVDNFGRHEYVWSKQIGIVGLSLAARSVNEVELMGVSRALI